MRSILLSTILLLASSGAVAAGQAPDWRLTAGDGTSVRLSQAVKERPVVLFFWATWCPYCKALMPHLQSIRLELGDKIEIFAIQIRDKADAVAFIENAGYDFTVFPQGDAVGDLYAIQSTPGVIVVDRSMVIQFDLRRILQPALPGDEETMKHSQKAAYLAPYWAAELRKALDTVVVTGNE